MSGEPSYLTEDNRLRSWFFTTDHKRVAILYFASITLFFFIGGAAATLIRLELIAPQGHLVTSDVYNRLFTLHGVIMVWFFLIPSIPNTLGNFIVPLTIGARDLAFPRLNLASWYLFMAGGLTTLYAISSWRNGSIQKTGPGPRASPQLTPKWENGIWLR